MLMEIWFKNESKFDWGFVDLRFIFEIELSDMCMFTEIQSPCFSSNKKATNNNIYV